MKGDLNDRVSSRDHAFFLNSMDDSLELPGSLAQKPTELQPEDDDHLSDDEEGNLDWTTLL